ncbi:hypothetical protein GO495_30950 [Chitinophaga oryziterrae]|uniref:Uncharacterized protein n=1 Tax=Chitinophaga oryziterrae TaxID=1031224 RepID=A0A6N8JII8_9BACT|nr:hypothetical protein [Chitinophaga oryziterrae]MVT45047.1 hypothetical protein [Chitinophaga oryziterrae]
MRTSLNNIKAIDDYLLGHMAPADAILFEANILLNNDLINEIQHQQSAYEIIRQYSRQKIKDEIVAVQEKLAAAPQYRGYMQRIANLFK